MIAANKDKIEERRQKVEMLEKEANIILKQIVIYLTIWGSTVAFLIKLIDFKTISDFFNLQHLLTLFPLFVFFAYLSFSFAEWIYTAIFRVREVLMEIKRINNATHV